MIPPPPPRRAELILARALRHDPSGPSILGDLREDHAKVAAARGAGAADRWYVREALLLAAGRTLTRLSHLPARISPMSTSLPGALRQDAAYALRSLRRSPGFALFTAAVIGLGVGATTAVFSVLQPFFLSPLPFADADRLVWIENVPDDGSTSLSSFTSRSGNLRDFRRDARSFAGITGYMAFFEQQAPTLTGDGSPERVTGVGVAHDFLEVLGVQPLLGRGFTEEEGFWDGPGAVVLAHGFWVRRFGADPGVVGTTLTLDGLPHLVAGVLPAGFDFTSIFTPGVHVDFLRPFPVSDETDRWGNTMFFVGRLNPGVTPEGAQLELDGLVAAMQQAEPDRWGLAARVTPLREKISAPFRPALALLLAAAATVLLIVCVNVTNLLLARAPRRAREVAVRKAFGASRGRLVRQLMLESVGVALAGALLGAALAWFVIRGVAGASGLGIPFLAGIELDGTALVFATGVALLTGLLVGVVPALGVSEGTEAAVLRAGGRGAGTSRGARRLREGLVVAEVTLACVLLVVGGLLVRSFQQVMDVDLGFRTESVATWQLNPSRGFDTTDEMADFYRSLTDRVRQVPGVTGVGLVDALPLGRERRWGARVAGGPGEERGPGHPVFPHMVDAGYLDVLDIPVVAGRGISADDRSGTGRVVVLNRSGARRIFGDVDPVGRILFVGGPGEVEVIGIVEDIRHSSPEAEAGNQVYFPLAQIWDFRTLDLAVHSDRPLSALAPAVSAALRELDPGMPTSEWSTLQDRVDAALSPRRFTLTILGAYGVVALLLAGLGIYGVLSQSVAERRTELGLRMALGATSGRVLRSVVGRTLVLTGVGIALGTVLSLGTVHLLESLLYGVAPTDPTTFLVMVAVLLAVATLAGGIPAWRAARIQGIQVLQGD